MNKKLLIIFLLIKIVLSGLADGFIIIDPVPQLPTPFPLEVKYHYVDVKINQSIAVTTIDQVFKNPTSRRLEGTYLFPVPENAVIQKFTMFVDGKELSAELLDKEKANQIYLDIVRSQLDPAILEYQDRSVYKMRIFPIEPKSEKRVKIIYQELLTPDQQTFEYLYPLNTEKFSSQNLEEVAINVEIEHSAGITHVFSTTHPLDTMKKSNQKWRVSYEDQNIKPAIDFKIYFQVEKDELGYSLAHYPKTNGSGHFLLSFALSHQFDLQELTEKDITFILDTSGSMEGKKLQQAKEAVTYCVN
ncbi:MAG: VIT and VWA domain-containing protein, partial [Spirochaetes bacterium]|nr:VIT and VWA domain-containing protein [Spirochaetota bacterium]